MKAVAAAFNKNKKKAFSVIVKLQPSRRFVSSSNPDPPCSTKMSL